MRILLARALIALRRDEEAHRELSQCLRHQPRCAEAYQLLGHVSVLRDEFDSAAIFLRECLRLNPHDAAAQDLLDILDNRWIQPTVAVEKLPAATAAVGPFVRPSEPPPPVKRLYGDFPPGRRLALGSEMGLGATRPAPASSPAHADSLRQAVRFGAYLVQIGLLSPSQLRKAVTYHERTAVRIGTAAAILGFATKPRIEWAAAAFHAGP